MRITGGKFKNRIVKTSGQKKIRPTSAKMREAIFSMIGQNLAGNSFLDAFGGSGIMGLEARSRGANPVIIVENNRASFRVILKIVKDLNAEIMVKYQDAKKAIQSRSWDIIFLDPPYALDIQPYLELSFLQGEYLIIAEMDGDRRFEVKQGWVITKERRYGSSKLVIFEKDLERPVPLSTEDNLQ